MSESESESESVGWNYLSIPKLQRLHRWSLRMNKEFHTTPYSGCNYLSMLYLQLIHVSERFGSHGQNLNKKFSSLLFSLIPCPHPQYTL